MMFAILQQYTFLFEAKVSETPCTDNAQCTAGHSECDTTTSMCKCIDTYTESTPDGTSCDPNAVQSQTSNQNLYKLKSIISYTEPKNEDISLCFYSGR
jgi:hypothetical protein